MTIKNTLSLVLFAVLGAANLFGQAVAVEATAAQAAAGTAGTGYYLSPRRSVPMANNGNGTISIGSGNFSATILGNGTIQTDNSGEILYTTANSTVNLAVTIGDSLTVGSGANHNYWYYLNLLPAIGNQYTLVTSAHGGDKSADQLALYTAQIKPSLQNAAYRKAKIIIWLGANDVADTPAYVNFAANITTFLSNFASDAVMPYEVYILTIHRHMNDASQVQEQARVAANKFLRQLEGTPHVHIVPVDVLFPDPSDTSVMYDHVHMLDAGYKMVAKALNDSIFNKGAEEVNGNQPAMIDNVRQWILPVEGQTRQGIEFLPDGNAGGTAGSNVTLNSLPPLGTGNFSLTVPFRMDDTSTPRTLIGGPAGALTITLKTTPAPYGLTEVHVGNTSGNTTTDPSIGKVGVFSKEVHFLTVTRGGAATVSTNETLYYDGLYIGNATDTASYSAPTTLGSAVGGNAWLGWIGAPILFNRATTATESITMAYTGQAPAADLVAARASQNTPILLTPWVSVSGGNGNFTSTNRTVSFANASSSTNLANSGNFAVTSGAEVLVTMNASLQWGSLPTLCLANNTAAISVAQQITPGPALYSFTANQTSATGKLQLAVAGASGTAVFIKDVNVFTRNSTLLLQPAVAQPGSIAQIVPDGPGILTSAWGNGSASNTGFRSPNATELNFTNASGTAYSDTGDTFGVTAGHVYQLTGNITVTSGTMPSIIIMKSDASGYYGNYTVPVAGNSTTNLVATVTGTAKLRWAGAGAAGITAANLKLVEHPMATPVITTNWTNSGSLGNFTANVTNNQFNFVQPGAGPCADSGNTFNVRAGDVWHIAAATQYTTGTSSFSVAFHRPDNSGYRSGFVAVPSGPGFVDLLVTETGPANVRFASSGAVTAYLWGVYVYPPTPAVSLWKSQANDGNDIQIVGAAAIAQEGPAQPLPAATIVSSPAGLPSGNATLASGTVTVSDARALPTSRFSLTRRAVNGSTTTGELSVSSTTTNSFVITSIILATPGSTQTGDTSVVDWTILNPPSQ